MLYKTPPAFSLSPKPKTAFRLCETEKGTFKKQTKNKTLYKTRPLQRPCWTQFSLSLVPFEDEATDGFGVLGLEI